MAKFKDMIIVIEFVNSAATIKSLIEGFGVILASQMAQIKYFLTNYYGEEMDVFFHALSERETTQEMPWGKLVSLYIGDLSPKELESRVYLQEYTSEGGPSGRQPKWSDYLK